jgi:hypothetical protein
LLRFDHAGRRSGRNGRLRGRLGFLNQLR